MYIPLLKCREAELSVAKTVCDYFSDNIIPLFEIFSDIYQKQYQKDPVTNEFIYVIKNGRRNRILMQATEDDIITLDSINQKIEGKPAFIDFLRVDANKYKNFDVKKADLGIRIRRFADYKLRVLEITKHKNFIPVISIRNAFNNSLNDMQQLYNEIKLLTNRVAVRITADVVDDYLSLLTSLRESDYILFDIEETDVGGLDFEIRTLMNTPIVAQKIILNSPRAASYQNKDFEDAGVTSLIDNSVLSKYKKLGFAGFGDYAGYKDVLPSSGLASRGAALALLYNYQSNAFWAFTNKDTSLGVRGYATVKPKVMSKRAELDPNHTCLAYQKLEETGNGNYTTWIAVCLIRYIEPLYNNMLDWN